MDYRGPLCGEAEFAGTVGGCGSETRGNVKHRPREKQGAGDTDEEAAGESEVTGR